MAVVLWNLSKCYESWRNIWKYHTLSQSYSSKTQASPIPDSKSAIEVILFTEHLWNQITWIRVGCITRHCWTQLILFNFLASKRKRPSLCMALKPRHGAPLGRNHRIRDELMPEWHGFTKRMRWRVVRNVDRWRRWWWRRMLDDGDGDGSWNMLVMSDEWQVMNDKWKMKSDEWWVMSDEWWWWWVMSYELRVTSYELWAMSYEWGGWRWRY